MTLLVMTYTPRNGGKQQNRSRSVRGLCGACALVINPLLQGELGSAIHRDTAELVLLTHQAVQR